MTTETSRPFYRNFMYRFEMELKYGGSIKVYDTDNNITPETDTDQIPTTTTSGRMYSSAVKQDVAEEEVAFKGTTDRAKQEELKRTRTALSCFGNLLQSNEQEKINQREREIKVYTTPSLPRKRP